MSPEPDSRTRYAWIPTGTVSAKRVKSVCPTMGERCSWFTTGHSPVSVLTARTIAEEALLSPTPRTSPSARASSICAKVEGNALTMGRGQCGTTMSAKHVPRASRLRSIAL
ncbi:hypothetical protein D3C73_1284870 [compost metagenome]